MSETPNEQPPPSNTAANTAVSAAADTAADTGANTPSSGPVTFAMHPRRPVVGNGVVIFVVVALAPLYMGFAGFGTVRLVRGLVDDATRIGLFAAVAAFVVVVVATAVFLRRRRRRLVRGPAVLAADAFTVTPFGRVDPVRIALADVSLLQRISLPAGLVIGTPSVRFHIGDGEFVDGGATTAIEGAIRNALGAAPDGQARLGEIERQRALTSNIIQRSAAATNALLAVVVVLFGAEFLTGALDDVGRMLALGANAPGLVQHGQLWRLVTAGFLHANVNHIFMNATALLSFGATLERLLGRHRFVIVAILASVGGNVASALVATHGSSVGASSCIWGLMGALFVVQRRARKQLPDALVVQPRRWAFILGVNGLISLLPGIDLFAHVGGFVTGVALAFFFLRDLDVRAPQASRRLVVAHVVVVVVTIACFAFAFVRAARLDDVARTNDVVEMALAVRNNPAVVNNGAWTVAQSGTTDAALLARAERGQREIVDEADATRAPSAESWRDTLAWLRFRQGAVDDAVALERVALTRTPKGAFATALARFLRQASPQPIAGVTIAPLTPGTATVDAGASTQPRVLYVELGDLGLWVVPLPPGDAPLAAAWPEGVPADVVAVPRLLSTTGPELGVLSGSQWFPRDATTAALP